MKLYIFSPIIKIVIVLKTLNIISLLKILLNFAPIKPPKTPPNIIYGSMDRSYPEKPVPKAIVKSLDAWENSIIRTESLAAFLASMEKNIVKKATFIGPPPIPRKAAINPKNIPIIVLKIKLSIL